jgi:hypothetical protein
VNKVDVMEARQGLHRSGGRSPAGRITHAPYRREPYVRAQLPRFGTVDAKAAAWTQTQVLLHWIDDNGRVHNEWVLALHVRRITREESSWRDPYDLEW